MATMGLTYRDTVASSVTSDMNLTDTISRLYPERNLKSVTLCPSCFIDAQVEMTLCK